MKTAEIFATLLSTGEDNTHRAAGLHNLTSRGELACRLVYPEGDDRGAVFVGCIEKISGRIESEETRRFAPRR
jgi:hypothetical protein